MEIARGEECFGVDESYVVNLDVGDTSQGLQHEAIDFIAARAAPERCQTGLERPLECRGDLKLLG